MYLLKYILLILGFLLTIFGYLIYFKKKYHLINNFEEDLRSERFDIGYAKRVGLIELTGGIAYIVIFFITFIVPKLTLFLFLASIICLIIALIVNHLKSMEN